MTIAQPLNVLHTTNDFFGNSLPSSDETFQKLREKPVQESLFITMMTECLTTIVTVLQRQYERYFNMDISEQLKEMESARTHNIDAEEIMGMFSAAKDHAPNATLYYLSSRMRSQKNNTVGYIDSLDTERRDE